MRINILGDSHTAALGPKIAAKLKNADVWFKSYPGYNTSRVNEAIADLELRPADWTIVILGGNDFGTREQERLDILRQLDVRDAGKILWVSPASAKRADVEARHSFQSDSQRDQFRRLGVPWMDSRPATQAGQRADGVHFTDTGYTQWANAIVERFNSLRRKSGLAVVMWSSITAAAAWIFYRTLRLGDRR